jgi:hypothetical protein
LIYFDAILAKNNIAREISKECNSDNYLVTVNKNYIIRLLKDIELYIGTANNPSVVNIFKNNTNINKNFNI